MSLASDDGSVVVSSVTDGVGIALAVVGSSDAHHALSTNRLRELDMPTQALRSRVDSLERQMDALAHVPERLDRLESQVLQLREEMRSEFSAVRIELAEGLSGVRSELGAAMRDGDEETRRTLREEIGAGDEETRRTLREEIRAGDEETRRVLREEIGALSLQMRMLHEDVIVRLTLIQEGQESGAAARRRKKSR